MVNDGVKNVSLDSEEGVNMPVYVDDLLCLRSRLNFQSQLLCQHGREVLKVSEKWRFESTA